MRTVEHFGLPVVYTFLIILKTKKDANFQVGLHKTPYLWHSTKLTCYKAIKILLFVYTNTIMNEI